MGKHKRILRIVAAAVQRDGIVFTGTRHGFVIKSMVETGFLKDGDAPITYTEQGFLDSTNRFVTRAAARLIAYQAGQVAEMTGELYSEDLW